MSANRLAVLRSRLQTWWHAPAFRVALIATLALRMGAGIFIAALLIVAPGPYAASWWYVFHQPPGVKIAVMPSPALTGPPGYLTTPWMHWDAVYYLQLAMHGYRPGDGAFLPLYPALAHVFGLLLGGHFTLGALVVSTIATFVTLLLLHRLATRLGASESVAMWAVVAAATLPISFYLIAPYAESLFLALFLATALAALDGRWWWAALFAALASVTRQQGPLLGLLALPTLLTGLATAVRGEYATLRARLGETWRACGGPLALLMAGSAAYLAWLVALRGIFGGSTPYELITSSGGWGLHFTLPGLGVVADLAAIWRDPAIAVTTNGHYALDAFAVIAGLAGLIITIRWLPTGLWLTLVACWCIALIKVDGDGFTTSAARYLLALLPLLVLPAGWLTRTGLAQRVAYLAVSLGLFGWYFGQWLLWGWVS